MRVRASFVAAAFAVVVTVGCIPPPPGPANPCAVTWDTREEISTAASLSPIVDVRAGPHECYDRLVVDLGGPVVPGYTVHYVDTVTHISSGEPIPLRGGAFLEVVVRAPAVDDNGQSTFPRAGQSELVDVTGFRTFRQVAWAGSQEGVTDFGLGVRARLPFRVFTLAGPGDGCRLVVDVAHS